jgi:hypothetical protein
MNNERKRNGATRVSNSFLLIFLRISLKIYTWRIMLVHGTYCFESSTN